jgi:hypothetical protein
MWARPGVTGLLTLLLSTPTTSPGSGQQVLHNHKFVNSQKELPVAAIEGSITQLVLTLNIKFWSSQIEINVLFCVSNLYSGLLQEINSQAFWVPMLKVYVEGLKERRRNHICILPLSP